MKKILLFIIFSVSTLLTANLCYGQGSQLPKYTVATLPPASSMPTYIVQVIDGATSNDCTVGGGSYNVFCTPKAGAWTTLGGSGGGYPGVTSDGANGLDVSGDVNVGTGAPSITLDGSTGNGTFSGAVAAQSANGVYSVAQFSGADAGAKINACFAALPSGHGTCDTRGLGTGIFPMSQITVGSGQKLQCDFGQEFQPTTAAETMVIQNNNSIITGCWFDASNQAAFSGKVISYTDNYRDGSQTTLEHSKLTAYPVRTGTAIYISATNAATQSIYTVAFNDVTIEGFQYGRYLTATTTGFINSVSFNGVQDSYSIIGTEINPTSTGLIARNSFIADNFQALIPGDIGIQIDGAGTWQQNYWTNLSIWDTNNGIVINNTTTNAGNFFSGSFDGYAVTDPTGTNTFCNQSNGVCKYGNTITLEASSIRSFGSVGGANLYAGGVLPFASQSEAMAGFNASTGNGEADWYTGLYTGGGSIAHQWWAPNSGATAWNSLMTLNDSGTLTPIGGFNTPNGTVIPSTALGYQGPAAGYVQTAPSATGTPGCLYDNGSGTRSWAACGGSGGGYPGVTSNGSNGLNVAGAVAAGSETLGSPLLPASGGTGANTAAGALANLGGLPLSGGTLTGALSGTSASFSGNVAAGATPSALATVAIIGDSLTQTTYGPLLGNAYAPLPSGLTVTNLGDSGQSPGQIAARIGAVPTYAISSTGTIPITGTATMTFTVGWEPVNSSTTGPYLHGTWGGVPGEATYSSGCCAWVPDGTGSPVSVNNIYGAQFIPDQPSRNAVAQIFGMGHNVSQQAPQYVYQNLLASVANVPPWELYAVWSNTYDNGNAAINWSGGQFWTINQQLNAWEQSTFGSHFIDVNTPMLAAYDPTSAVDIEDATIHLVEPSSLRAVYGYGTLTNAISATATSIQMTCVGGSNPLNGEMLVFDTGANQELAFITAASGSCPGTITYTVNRLGIGNNEAHSAGVPAYNVDNLHMATPCIASLTGGNANNPHGWCGGQYIATAVATYVTANYNPSSAQAPAFTGLPDGSARLPSTLPTSTTQSQYGSAGNPVALVNAQIGWFSGNISMGMGIINAPQANFATLNLGNLQNTNGPPLSFFPSGSNYYFSPGSGATVFLGSGSNPFSWIYGGSESLTSTSGGLYGVGSALLLPSGNAQPANYLIGTGLSGGSYGPKSLASLGLVGTGSANTFTANQTISNSTGPQLTLNNGSGTTLGITQSGSYTIFNASSGYYDFQIAGKNIAEILAGGAEWLSLGTATSSSGNYNSVATIYYGSYWNGSSAVSDGWSVGESLSSGTTPTSVFYISKTGGAASWQVQMPNTVLIGATPTVSASQVGFGNSTTASSSCGSLTSSAGCLTINVAGTPHYIPYY